MAETHEPAEEGPVDSHKTILVVEDDEGIGMFITQAIQEETPYEAILACDGLEALKIARNVRCHLFLLDYQLPGIDGLELYDRLHTLPELTQVPAIFMSASFYPPREEIEKRSLTFVQKPFDLDTLLHAVQQLLDK